MSKIIELSFPIFVQPSEQDEPWWCPVEGYARSIRAAFAVFYSVGGYWSVTHRRTGRQVARCSDRDCAFRLIDAIDPVADWNAVTPPVSGEVRRAFWDAIEAEFGDLIPTIAGYAQAGLTIPRSAAPDLKVIQAEGFA
jgi:hypothetical protein